MSGPYYGDRCAVRGPHGYHRRADSVNEGVSLAAELNAARGDGLAEGYESGVAAGRAAAEAEYAKANEKPKPQPSPHAPAPELRHIWGWLSDTEEGKPVWACL